MIRSEGNGGRRKDGDLAVNQVIVGEVLVGGQEYRRRYGVATGGDAGCVPGEMYEPGGLASEAVRRGCDKGYASQSAYEMGVIVDTKADIFRVAPLIGDAHLDVDKLARKRDRRRRYEGSNRHVMRWGEYENGG